MKYLFLLLFSFNSYSFNEFNSNDLIESSKINENINKISQLFLDKLEVNLNKPNINEGDVILSSNLNDFFAQLNSYDSNSSFLNLSGTISSNILNQNFNEALRIANEEIHFKSCEDILNKGYSEGSKEYTIDLDGLGVKEPINILCDMTTDGGGWMVIVENPSTDINYLSRFGDTSEINSTFYSNPNYGINWGTNNNSMKNYIIDIPYSKFKITYSGFYASPSGGLGYMNLIDSSGVYKLISTDAWTSDSVGQSLTVNGNNIFTKSQQNIIDRVDTVNSSSNSLRIQMSGYTSAYGYTRRYIRRLLLK